MAISTGTLGPLLQGVSQQDDKVRLEGQVTEQINLLSDVTEGLSTRPATTSVSSILNTSQTMEFRDVEFNGQSILLGYETGSLKAWYLNGTEIPVEYTAPAVPGYLGADMRFHVVDDKIVMTNRDVAVDSKPAAVNTRGYLAVFWLKGGEYSRQYIVQVNFGNSTQITARYDTPDGNNEGDGVKASSIRIALELEAQLKAAAKWPAAAKIERYHDAVTIWHPTMPIRLSPGDGTGGETLKIITDTVRDPSDLPKYAAHGMIVEVRVSKATEDNYYLRFNAKGITTESELMGFGREGTWEEWRNPYQVEAFELSTMPHIIKLVDGKFKVSHGEWLPRQVGDEKSAPFPSIKGKPIRDIGGFESRLVLLTPNTVVMSRTNHPFDLWRESATVVSATDPIDMTSTKKDDLRLDWLVPFDRDMFIVADPGDSQFVIRGGGVDPSNASMVLTTEYELESAGAAPVSTGRTLLMPYKVGNYSGLNEFYTNSDNAAQAANSLTASLSKYIQGTITHIAVSQNFNLAVISTDFDSGKDLWVYKYLWDGSKILQSSWSIWRFRDRIRHFFFRGARLYMVTSNEVTTHVEVMDLNRPASQFGYHISMDSSKELTTVAHEMGSKATYQYNGAVYLQGTGCQNPGYRVVPLMTNAVGGNFEAVFDASIVPVGAKVVAGMPVVWELQPTQVFAKDYQGRVDSSRNVTIQEYIVSIKDSGYIKANFYSPYSEMFTFEEGMVHLDDEPAYPNAPYLISEDVVIPWGERSDWSSLKLWGDDFRPVTITEVQWAGQIHSPRGKRA